MCPVINLLYDFIFPSYKIAIIMLSNFYHPGKYSKMPTQDNKASVILPRQPFEPEMVPIPAGEFWMGSRDVDKDADTYERPRHKVWLNAYSIGRYPVTVAQFRVFIERSAYKTTAEMQGDNYTWRTPRGKNSNIDSKEQHPVTCVSREDAQVYCQWLSEITGRRYGLPTEAQWEKAARGKDERIYAWGNTLPTKENKLCNIQRWFNDTTPVGQFSPAGDSPYGCADITGNVWEWCEDWYGESYYGVSPRRNPTGPASGTHRVVRGGSWPLGLRDNRCAQRADGDQDNFDSYVGFRVVSPDILLGFNR